MIEQSRRTTLLGLAAAGSALLSPSRGAAQTPDVPNLRDQFAPENRELASDWMDKWIGSQKKLDGTLRLSRFADPIYFLLKPIRWSPDSGAPKDLPEVTVPVGFVTDFASIPRVFWSALRQDGLYAYAAIVHDFLYWTQTVSRDVADSVFKYGMEDLGVSGSTTFVIYQAVHLFGGAAWTENARLRDQGEERVLRRFPTDPRTTWAQWKSNKDVFR